MAKRSRCAPCFALIKLHLFSDCTSMPPTPAEYDSCTSRSCLTTPLPELLMVAQKLPRGGKEMTEKGNFHLVWFSLV